MKSRIVLQIFLILIVTGCKKSLVNNDDQLIFFQYEIRNEADPAEHSGFFITGNGEVIVYNNPAGWHFPAADGTISSGDLTENINLCRHSGLTVSTEEMSRHTGLISNISSSKIFAKKETGTKSQGTTGYYCYQRISGENYKQFIIRVEGADSWENLNFFSKKVISWMKSIRFRIPRDNSGIQLF